VVEIPCDDAVEFLLSILTALDGRPSHVDRGVSVQPLLAKHGEEGGEDRRGEAGVQHRLDLDDPVRRARPLWERGDISTESGVVYLVNQDAEEVVRLVVGVLLEVGIDLDDECGCHSGEQTGLRSYSEYVQLNGEHDSRI